MGNPTHEADREIVRRLYEEVFNRQDHHAIDTLIAPDITIHDPMMGDLHGIEAFRQFAAVFLDAFAQQQTTVERLVAEDDLVAVLHTHTGVHTGSFMGMPPTGRAINVRGIELFRVSNGKIAELWRMDDDAGLLRQLGVISAGAAANA